MTLPKKLFFSLLLLASKAHAETSLGGAVNSTGVGISLRSDFNDDLSFKTLVQPEDHGFGLNVDFLLKLLPEEASSPYIGVGERVKTWGDDHLFATRIPIGYLIKFDNAPFELSGEFAPNLTNEKHVRKRIDLEVSLRYIFDRQG